MYDDNYPNFLNVMVILIYLELYFYVDNWNSLSKKRSLYTDYFR